MREVGEGGKVKREERVVLKNLGTLLSGRGKP
jgi:hypothetical protein